jgi:hypothetical protein
MCLKHLKTKEIVSCMINICFPQDSTNQRGTTYFPIQKNLKMDP